MTLWEDDEDFLDWLESEDLNDEDEPLDDEILDLMYRAWRAGIDSVE